ncbi:MAG: DUF1569 domain-containing protein [Phycisphaerae bacterium]|jgi:hypothetical protein|nr:DUF1569 domain-containing protein [Phycisphaerae bacterium]MCZ2399908.1 DUF1569 domain-containing protein [Phycisphaerae bacterium]NUQ49709.1 DUF1569 domain-containing protein [Phycisphaerae bacterium]
MRRVTVSPATAPRRALRFSSIDELLREVELIEVADAAGRLRCAGAWTAGQILGHLAAWIDYAYEGYPGKRPPWLVRFIVRLSRKRYLYGGLPAGVRIPDAPGGTYGTEVLSTEEGARRLRAALERLGREPARHDSPVFGSMTQEERIALNLRHAELHLSFLHRE